MIKKINLDTMRLLAAILVVCIHTYPFLTINADFDFFFTHVFCRIAVPFFLMVTGYFVMPKSLNDKHYLVEYSKKIIKIYILCILLYLPVHFYTGTFQTMNIVDYFKWLFINGTFYHLWYFPALIFGIWLLSFFLKYIKESIVQIILFILFLIGLLGDSYYGMINNISFLEAFYNCLFSIFDYTRNGLFYAPIFLYMGYYFSKIEWKLDFRKNIFFLCYFLVMLELEGFLLQAFGLQRHDSMYVMLIPVLMFLFPFLLQLKGENKNMRNLSMIVYIIHPLIIILVRGIAKAIHMENLLIYHNLLHFIIVSIFSILSGCLLRLSYSAIKKRICLKKK